jgi:hypothetical protein
MKYRTTTKAIATFVVAVAMSTLILPTANALPNVGDGRPELRLVDAWDRTFELRATANKPILVIYEDKDSAHQNDALKDELARLAKGDRYKQAIVLLAIADVDGYAYWPVKGFVKDAIKDQSHKFGTVIYCDWTGAVRTKMGLRKNTSNVILYGRDGKVLFSAEGRMSNDQRAKLIALLRSQVDLHA